MMIFFLAVVVVILATVGATWFVTHSTLFVTGSRRSSNQAKARCKEPTWEPVGHLLERFDSLHADPVDRHPMLSKGLECVTHSLFQTKSYQLPSCGESVFTKTGGLNRSSSPIFSFYLLLPSSPSIFSFYLLLSSTFYLLLLSSIFFYLLLASPSIFSYLLSSPSIFHYLLPLSSPSIFSFYLSSSSIFS